MSLPHEDAARKEYPTATEFIAAQTGIFRIRTIGWTFKVKNSATSGASYAWITIDMRITSDLLHSRREADRYMKSYVHAIEHAPRGSVVAKNTGSAAATDGGNAVTGISYTTEVR